MTLWGCVGWLKPTLDLKHVNGSMIVQRSPLAFRKTLQLQSLPWEQNEGTQSNPPRATQRGVSFQYQLTETHSFNPQKKKHQWKNNIWFGFVLIAKSISCLRKKIRPGGSRELQFLAHILNKATHQNQVQPNVDLAAIWSFISNCLQIIIQLVSHVGFACFFTSVIPKGSLAAA